MSEAKQLSRGWWLIVTAAMLAAAVWVSAYAARPKLLTMTVLDVGEGACTVLRTPSGKTVVVDCGTSSWRKPTAVGDKLAAPYLRSLGVNRIDVIVLTHPHSDHVSGMSRLVEDKPAKLALDLGARHASPYYLRYLQDLKKAHTAFRIAKRGQSVDLRDGVVLQILSPDPAKHYEDLNEGSMVIRVLYGKAAFMLMGDACADAEEHILDWNRNVRSQVLLVGHHGSRSGTTPAWLAAVKPKVAVISCGRNNEYHHPSPAVLDRLANAGVRIYRTDRIGAVTVTTDGSSIHTEGFRRAAAGRSR